MKRLVDPKQKTLFDPFASVFSELAYQHVRQGWQGVFRHVILELLPAEEIGRTRLMGVAVKRFLTQLKRHAPAAYQELPEELRRRYAPSEHPLFADAKDAERRSRQRQQAAEDMYFLVERFGDDAAMAKRSSYQSLVLIFQQQCVVEVCCPAGEAPLRSAYDPETQTTTVLMPASACGRCPFRGECPVQAVTGGCQLRFTDKERRLEERRREEGTDAFRERYAARAGIESTNSGLKRRSGMGALRVRGSPSVFQALLLKIAGWNVCCGRRRRRRCVPGRPKRWRKWAEEKYFRIFSVFSVGKRRPPAFWSAFSTAG